jgi:predicted NBD/HSP70 family sugar kinase
MAGAIDRRAGVCRFSPFLRWRNVPLRSMLEARLSLPVVVENDVNTLAMAERWFGAGAGVADFVVVTLGRGVGLGMVVDGRLYRGGRGAGGEFGHVTVEPDGPPCECGKRGCLEALVGEPGLRRRLREAVGRDLTLTDGAALARSGDPTARAVFSEAGRTLGLALAGVVNLLNPVRLIVGGEGVETLDLLMDSLRAALAEHCFDGLFADLELVVEPWGDDAWARGAAALMLDQLFHPPLYRHEDGLTADRAEEMPA